MKKIKIKNGELLEILPATLEDAEDHARYINIVKNETRFLSLDSKDGESTVNSQSKWINSSILDNRKIILMAKINGEIVGCGNVSPIYNSTRFYHRCEIGISVKKEFWGLGIASEILKQLIVFAKEQNYEQMELQVVEENIPAINLYKKFGFYETGFIKNGMKYTDGTYTKLILLQKDL